MNIHTGRRLSLSINILLCCVFVPLSAIAASVSEETASADSRAFIYGQVTLNDGTVHEGRLRWGGDEEALWSHHFNGVKRHNPWAKWVPEDRLLRTREVSFIGIPLGVRQRPMDLERPLMVPFGDIDRLDASGRDLTVTLKSGLVVQLDRCEADDFADGLTIELADGSQLSLNEWSIKTVRLIATPPNIAGDSPLWGTVHTAQGTFSGLVQWNREAGLVTDKLEGKGRQSLRFEDIRTITRQPDGSITITLREGETLMLSGAPDAGDGHRGLYIDDLRYGRVLVTWQVFDRFEIGAPAAPATPIALGYADFLAGQELAGDVIARDGTLLSGRIVFDLDESETTQTLDAPIGGVHYLVPFGKVATIDLSAQQAGGGEPSVILHDGNVLRFEPSGDLGPDNAGVLVFLGDRERPEYLAWEEVERINFVR